MRHGSLSTITFVLLVVLLAILAGVNVFLPQGDFLPLENLPAEKPVLALVNAGIMIFLYGALGLVGLVLARKLGFPDLWDRAVSNWERFGLPALAGIGLGLLFIGADLFFSRMHPFGLLPHPPFPTSLVASAVAGIGEEIVFRLFFVSFWLWLVSHVLLGKRWQGRVFWIVAVASALAFTAAHVPSLVFLLDLGHIGDVPIPLLAELLLLNGALSLFAADFLRKYGFLAPVGLHFWTDVVWHVLWGMV